MRKADLGRIIEEKRERFIELNDKIWEFAETAFTDFSPRSCSAAPLRTGFSVERGTGGVATAFCGSWGTARR